MAYFLSPLGNTQTIDANGDPLVSGTISTFLAGTSTPETTYTDDTGGTQQGVVMTLNSLGYPTNGPVWMLGGVPLKFIIKNALGVTQSTFDDISGIGDTSAAADQWLLYGAPPTYISAVSFSVVGDQTNTFQVNRRLKSVNGGGTVYSTIATAVFAASITTVTVTNTSGVLDSDLSAVSYSVLTADNQSIPAVSEAISLQTGTTYTYAKGDKGKLVTHTNAAAIAGTLPVASTTGAGWWMDVQNRGAGVLTITPTTSTIDGAASLVLIAGQGARIVSDGTNYYTQRGAAKTPTPATTITGALATGSTTIPSDDTIPQITEGDQYMSLAFTPNNAASTLEIDVVVFGGHSAVNTYITACLFQDAISNALAVGTSFQTVNNATSEVSFKFVVSAASVTARTYRVRAGGNNAGTFTFNGAAGSRQYGGVFASSITIKEYLP